MLKRSGRLKGGCHGEVGSLSHAGTPPIATVSVRLLKQPTRAGICYICRNKEDRFTKQLLLSFSPSSPPPPPSTPPRFGGGGEAEGGGNRYVVQIISLK